MIEVGEFGKVLSDDAVLALEMLQETHVTCCHNSLEAVVETKKPNTVRISAMVGNQQMILLIDSRSSHTFVNKVFAKRVGCLISLAL
jgi:hypothetical protein